MPDVAANQVKRAGIKSQEVLTLNPMLICLVQAVSLREPNRLEFGSFLALNPCLELSLMSMGVVWVDGGQYSAEFYVCITNHGLAAKLPHVMSPILCILLLWVIVVPRGPSHDWRCFVLGTVQIFIKT